jgi:hypothetical protein
MGCASETHFPCRGEALALCLLRNQPTNQSRTFVTVIKPTPLAPPDGLEQPRGNKISGSITRMRGEVTVVHVYLR